MNNHSVTYPLATKPDQATTLQSKAQAAKAKAKEAAKRPNTKTVETDAKQLAKGAKLHQK